MQESFINIYLRKKKNQNNVFKLNLYRSFCIFVEFKRNKM